MADELCNRDIEGGVGLLDGVKKGVQHFFSR